MLLAVGSSPLARGTPDRRPGHRQGERFIPARAGNTPGRGMPATASPVHPRSRGEHPTRDSRWMWFHGSSPLARGTRPSRPKERGHRRFIPARAGNTVGAEADQPWSSVHPRSRGEHPHPRVPQGGIGGSSPLARGTRHRARRVERDRRFIPARAGNTGRSRTGWGGRAVHPRSRGEHHAAAVVAVGHDGSSPLARGTPG